MFCVNNPIISKKFFSEIITSGIAKEETKEAVKLLVNMSEVSKAWLELSRALIVNLLNNRDWSLKDIVVFREKKVYPSLSISNFSYTTLETNSLVCFFKIFGRNLNKKPLVDEVKYPNEITELLSYYAPKLWDLTEEIEKLEEYVTTLDPDIRDKIIERFREASQTRVLDILSEGILEWFSDIDLDPTTKIKITELNIKICNYLENNYNLIKNLLNIYLKNFCGFKIPYEKKGWETAFSDFINYLRDCPDKELTKKILKTLSEGSGDGIFDFLIPLSTWIKDLNIPVKIKLHLFDLEKEIQWEMERLCKNDDAFGDFCMSLRAKLISLGIDQ